MIRNFRAVIIGAPGSGKGTISSRIVRKFGVKHISSGDLLRQHVLRSSQIGKEAKSYINAGKLVPDQIIFRLILEELKAADTDSWLLDGFPRTQVQARLLRGALEVDAAVNLVVPFDIIVERLSKRWVHLPSGRVYNTDFKPPKVPGVDDLTGEKLVQRKDDRPDAMRKRLEEYTDIIGPVLEYYREEGLLEEFAGSTSDEIWPMVYKFVASHISPVCQDVKL